MTQESQQPTESMNFHLCTESPCPLQDKECADILNNAMSTNYTQQPIDKQTWWMSEFEKKYRHAKNIDATEHCDSSCDIRHEYFYHSLSIDKFKSFISHVAEESKRIGAEEERRRILDEVREYCKQTCESYKQTGLFCSEDEDLQGILDILSNRTKP